MSERDSPYLASPNGDTDGSPVIALAKSAPPEYSDIIKDQRLQQGAYPVQHVQQPGLPQFVYTQQPGVQPSVQKMPYMVQAPFQQTTFPRPNYPGPHDFLMLVVITTAILAILNPISLVFGLPSSIMSILVKNRKEKGDYPGAKKYANIALGLTIVNMIFALGGIAVFVGMSGWTFSRGNCFRVGIRSSTGEYFCS